ncbi:MAG: glycosyltransferase family 4 protein [Flavobacteriales bacterium]|nr:glycosyltransferase family 4 protein [Flavobacteriales bacterium]
MKALFLYTEAAPYVLACLQRLAEGHGVEVHLVRWPVNAEAPFAALEGGAINDSIRDRMDDAGLYQRCMALSPDIVFVSGWVDKGYLRVARALRAKGVPVVLCSDTAWRGDLRQWANVLLSRFWMKRTFSHAWVTGKAQWDYARYLGFRPEAIRTGFYSADTTLFEPLGRQLLAERSTRWPHRFLCVARYIPTKGHQLLCDAFAELCDSGEADDWELLIAGTGELHEQVKSSTSGKHERIRHLGFKQAEEMQEVVAQCGAFVLPSLYEPWGVVVHEHACAGLPLVLSSAVGASERFLQEGRNGFRFPSGDKARLKDALRGIIRRTDPELQTMGRHSADVGRQWSPTAWADTAMEFLSNTRHGK